VDVERNFKVLNKGLKGKHHNTPFILLVNADSEKLELHLEAKSQLSEFEIEDMFVFRLTPSKQGKLT
jgi:hypothetical protein